MPKPNFPGGGTGTDVDAIHVNVASEIIGIPAKVLPVLADTMVIEDSEALDIKASMTLDDLPTTTLVDTRFLVLEDQIEIYEIFENIAAGTAGTITAPTDSTILLDRYEAAGDALIVKTDANGRPIDEPARTAGGVIITTTLDVAGNYSLSGTPSAYPVSLIYQVSIARVNRANISTDQIVAKFELYEAEEVAITDAGAYYTGSEVEAALQEVGAFISVANPENTFTISPSGSDYTSIQAALDDNAVGGELFIVYPGTYTDTINFTANNQCVKGVGNAPQQIVQQADATVSNFGAFTGCYIERVNMRLTAPTVVRDMIAGSGNLLMQLCRLETSQSAAITGTQSTIVNTSGTVRMYLTTCVYNNTSIAGGGD
ncbi:hypothetical protein, partial [Pseudoalteromonas sp.]|uniref:hypothetical protein n=1 Tax=Pseudoalteromonas sp. TaxID=53249 RepID=UPI002632A8DA